MPDTKFGFKRNSLLMTTSCEVCTLTDAKNEANVGYCTGFDLVVINVGTSDRYSGQAYLLITLTMS